MITSKSSGCRTFALKVLGPGSFVPSKICPFNANMKLHPCDDSASSQALVNVGLMKASRRRAGGGVSSRRLCSPRSPLCRDWFAALKPAGEVRFTGISLGANRPPSDQVSLRRIFCCEQTEPRVRLASAGVQTFSCSSSVDLLVSDRLHPLCWI